MNVRSRRPHGGSRDVIARQATRLPLLLLVLSVSAPAAVAVKSFKHIHVRDPFVLVSEEEERYYLYGTTDADPWHPPATGFDVYYSESEWELPTHQLLHPIPLLPLVQPTHASYA